MDPNILDIDKRIQIALDKPRKQAPPWIPTTPEFTTWFLQHFAIAPARDLYDFYLIETLQLLSHFEKDLRRPIQFHFCKPTPRTLATSPVVRDFFYVLSRLPFRLNITMPLLTCAPSNVCACKTPEFVLEENDFFLCCSLCGERFELGNIAMNYGDSKRLSLSQKNSHDKRHHFSECIDKFQGIQKYEFPPLFFETLEEQLCAFHLVNQQATTRAEKFAQVKKEHIKLILKNMRVHKQYKEDINVIYKLLTENPMPRIDHLKSRLLEDFVAFDERYNHLFSKAKKSAYHYVLILYQLLRSYGFPCDKADFNFLKTADRKFQHEVKYRQVFESLGWNYTEL